MDHSVAPLHWGYSGSNAPTGNNNWGAPQPRGTKRTISESDDCDDVFSEESSKEHCTSPGDTDSCQMLSRKKRRGVIEKKRRDRINTSLTELKRLVPSAFEKQGSAKLEKAEILQLTVDHLKMLHAKGLDTLAYDHQRFAMDYHNIGYRECATEVARYLVSIEGMDIQDPLRLRLMSHLQCFAAQRELATKPAATWGYGAAPQPYTTHHNPVNTHTPLNTIPVSPHGPSNPTLPSSNLLGNLPSQQLHHQHQPTIHDNHNTYTDLSTSCSQGSDTSRLQLGHQATSTSAPLTPLATSTTTSLSYPAPHPHQYYPMNLNSFNPSNLHHQHGYNPNTSKPYRPWGAEVAY